MSSMLQNPANIAIVQIEPWIDEAELRELQRVISSTFLAEHELTREFEAQIARLTGSRHAIAVCNGSMALYVCLKATGIGPGDEVIVPNLTFITSANAVILAGATPVLCEVREDTFCIDVERAERLLTRRTRAIMPVQLYGQCANMYAVSRFAQENELMVIEDAAEGIGVKFEGRHAGTFGDIGMLSFGSNQTVTCGQGGIVLTDSDKLAKFAYRLKNYGRDQKNTFVHASIGFNFAFSDLQAAIGLAQLKKMDRIIARKQQIHDEYVRGLSGVPGVEPIHVDPRCEPVFWFTSFLCDDAEKLSAWLSTQKIQTRRLFCPLHLQPCYADRQQISILDEDFEVSERIYRRGISLPSSYRLTPQEQAFVIDQIRTFYMRRDPAVTTGLDR